MLNISNQVNIDFLDENFEIIKSHKKAICFSYRRSFDFEKHKNVKYIRYIYKSNLEKEKIEKFFSSILDLFHFIKDKIIEKNVEEILKNKSITISIKEHDLIILAIFTIFRYVEEYADCVEFVLSKLGSCSFEEAFFLAHNADYKDGEKASVHSLIPFKSRYSDKKLNPDWINLIRKKLDISKLENGSLNKIQTFAKGTEIQNTFYYDVIK